MKRLATDRLRQINAVMAAVFGFSTFSATLGLVGEWNWVRTGEQRALSPLPDKAVLLRVLPIDHQFGYFAPQVAYDYRLELRLASHSTGEETLVKVPLQPEARQLYSTFESHSQDSESAGLLATSLAEYGFARYPRFDRAEVRVLYRLLPPIEMALKIEPQWVVKERYYLRR